MMLCCCKPAKDVEVPSQRAEVALTRTDADLDGDNYTFGGISAGIERMQWTPPPTGAWREMRRAICFIWPSAPGGIPSASTSFVTTSNQAAIASGNLFSFPRGGIFELHGTAGSMFSRDIDHQAIQQNDPVNAFVPQAIGSNPVTFPLPYPSNPPTPEPITELDALFAQWRTSPTIVLQNLFDATPTTRPVFEVGIRFTTIHDDGANGLLALNEGNVYFNGITTAV